MQRVNFLSLKQTNGIWVETSGPSVDSSVGRDIRHNTIEKILQEGPFAASDMEGTADYILDVACRISPFGVPHDGVAWEVVQGGPLAPYIEFLSLLFGGTLQCPISPMWYAIGS